MPLPSCFPILNTAYFDNLISQINATSSAEDLQTLINQVYGEIGLFESTIQSQVDKLAPVLALLSAPSADPTAIVTWLTSFITDFLTPYVVPYTTYAAQLTALTAEVAAMTSAIEAVAATKFPGITITIPSITPSCKL